MSNDYYNQLRCPGKFSVIFQIKYVKFSVLANQCRSQCGANSMCIGTATPNATYQCECLNGYKGSFCPGIRQCKIIEYITHATLHCCSLCKYLQDLRLPV